MCVVTTKISTILLEMIMMLKTKGSYLYHDTSQIYGCFRKCVDTSRNFSMWLPPPHSNALLALRNWTLQKPEKKNIISLANE